eukprot:6574904-Prorocentrum_lima.AAC.1
MLLKEDIESDNAANASPPQLSIVSAAAQQMLYESTLFGAYVKKRVYKRLAWLKKLSPMPETFAEALKEAKQLLVSRDLPPAEKPGVLLAATVWDPTVTESKKILQCFETAGE